MVPKVTSQQGAFALALPTAWAESVNRPLVGTRALPVIEAGEAWMATEQALLDQTFSAIMRSMIRTGRAPHYTEVAEELGLSPEDGRRSVLDLFSSGVSGWLFPDTDYISSFAPFSNLPTQYRIAVDGEERWFAQCGFEALAATWVFPGKTVSVRFPCLDCGERSRLEIRDGTVLEADPAGLVGYVAVPLAEWAIQLPFA